MRVLTAVVASVWLCGCRANLPGEDFEGVYRQNLANPNEKEVDLESIVRIDKEPSIVKVTLFLGSDGMPTGFMNLDGDIQIAGALDVWDFGSEDYPIKNFDIRGRHTEGTIKIQEMVDVSLDGTFAHDFHNVRATVRANLFLKLKLGELTLVRVKDHVPQDVKDAFEAAQEARSEGNTDTGDTALLGLEEF